MRKHTFYYVTDLIITFNEVLANAIVQAPERHLRRSGKAKSLIYEGAYY